MVKYQCKNYLFKNIPHWIRLACEFFLVLMFYVLLANLGITNYRHEMNPNFVSIIGLDSIITGLVLGTLYVLYNIIFNNKIVEEVSFDDTIQNVQIIYVSNFIKRKRYNILYRNLKYELEKKIGFKYYDYVLRLVDKNKKSFKIKAKKYGWDSEEILAIENELKSKVMINKGKQNLNIQSF